MRIAIQSLLFKIQPAPRPAARILSIILLSSALLLHARCSDTYSAVTNLDSPKTAIVCFGNSITAGYGVGRDQAFPALVAKRLGATIINAGHSGDTTADALGRLDRDVLSHDPRLVIVEFGGNDFLKKADKAQTFRNLDRVIERITARGAMAIVMEMRIGFLGDKYLPDYRKIAETRGAVLIPDFMSGILGNHELTIDGLHPTSEGHELIAERVMKELVPLLEEANRSRAGTR